MVTYLEAHPTKVQTYISRWSDLRGRRGASTMLRNAFTASGFAELCRTQEITINEHAIELEGSVSVVVDSDDDTIVRGIAEALASWIRIQCPAAEFFILTANADSHSEVGYHATKIRDSADQGKTRLALTHRHEVPLVARCTVTGSDSAVGVSGVPTQRRALGADAVERLRTGAFRTAEERRTKHRKPDKDDTALGTEARLGRDLGFDATCKQGFGAVTDFEDLAGCGPSGFKRNHLATVYCDGNAIGALIHDAKDTTRHSISKQLKDAAEKALLATGQRVVARCGTGPDRERSALPITPHILGGDDVLFTVPAGVGLLAAETFCGTFAELSPATASAAIVYHHIKFPFPMVSANATKALQIVKGQHPGSSAVGVVDITRAGGIIDSSLPTMSFDAIDSHREALDWLAALGKSTRSQLESASCLDEELVARARLLLIVSRNKELAERSALLTDLDWLTNALPITQWWPTAKDSS